MHTREFGHRPNPKHTVKNDASVNAAEHDDAALVRGVLQPVMGCLIGKVDRGT